jgi:hypothetical protein
MIWPLIWVAQSACCIAGTVWFLVAVFRWLRRRAKFRYCLLSGVVTFGVLPLFFGLVVAMAR